MSDNFDENSFPQRSTRFSSSPPPFSDDGAYRSTSHRYHDSTTRDTIRYSTPLVDDYIPTPNVQEIGRVRQELSYARTKGLTLTMFRTAARSLEKENYDLRASLRESRSQCRETEIKLEESRSAYTALLGHLGTRLDAALAGIRTNSGGFQFTLSDAAANFDKTPPNRKDYKHIKFWTKESWDKWNKAGSGAVTDPHRDDTQSATGEQLVKNKKLRYIQEEDGETLLESTAEAMRKYAPELFLEIEMVCKTLPERWLDTPRSARSWFNQEMKARFPCLGLGDDDWKITDFASIYFSNFIRPRLESKNLKRPNDTEQSSGRIRKTPRICNNTVHSEEAAVAPTIDEPEETIEQEVQHAALPPAALRVPRPRNPLHVPRTSYYFALDNIQSSNSTSIAAGTPANSTSRQVLDTRQTHAALNSRRRQDRPITKSATPAGPSTLAATATDSAPSSIPVDGTPDVPARESPLPPAINPTPVAGTMSSQLPPPTPTASRSRATARQSASSSTVLDTDHTSILTEGTTDTSVLAGADFWTPGDRVTPRLLCAIEWCAQQDCPTEKVFNKYWKSVDKQTWIDLANEKIATGIKSARAETHKYRNC
ncbi:hypothetical protein BXZ70DRAFT_1080141 [Cristinia sonorae]|uniref:Uncharacterized protein n=1 Tax=Cristinia sonorae TaxID=1940300 RepID=A0A8K0UIB4_9AGAR|nr:hypothetical protein BXZ70DRAFT_1080141 [Cristinia sonorae]